MLAVGGVGMISTANYEARKYGVRAAMPGFIALKLCPHLKFVDLNFPKYEAAAAAARTVFARFDPNYSSRGLDEASLCVTEYCNESGCTPSQVQFLLLFIVCVSFVCQSILCILVYPPAMDWK